MYNSLMHNNLPFTQCSQLREEVATLRDKLSFQVEERSQMESTTTQLKDKLHQAEVSHSSTKGEVSSSCSIVYIPKFLWNDEFHEQMFLYESNHEYVDSEVTQWYFKSNCYTLLILIICDYCLKYRILCHKRLLLCDIM